MKKEVPNSLRTWFIIHFFIDILFAVPLMFFSVIFLSFLGFSIIDPLMPRLVAAALIGIGSVSFISRNKGIEVYSALLNLKIIWSLSAIFGILISLDRNTPIFLFVALGIFALFSCIWVYYKIILSKF